VAAHRQSQAQPLRLNGLEGILIRPRCPAPSVSVDPPSLDAAMTVPVATVTDASSQSPPPPTTANEADPGRAE
jgi:hypothetical protein